MKISTALDGLKENPAQIAVIATTEKPIFPRALFWHPARGRFAIYEIETYSCNGNATLKEVAEIDITELASELWIFTDFNTWYQSETARLYAQEKARRESAAAKKAASTVTP